MMDDILTAISVVLSEGITDIDAVILPGEGVTDEQYATLKAVLENERLMAVLDKWFALDIPPDQGVAMLFCNRKAKAVLDEFWAVYDQERELGNIPEASPWWD